MIGRSRLTLAAMALLAMTVSCSDDTVVADLEPQETINAPDVPSGPTSVIPDSLVTFRSGGAKSSLGHDVEYRFHFGRGNMSAWSTAPEVMTSWTSAGRHEVTTQARCSQHPLVQSNWSGVTTLRATPETISAPDPLNGLDHLCTGSVANYATGGAMSSVGHGVEYQYDWGDRVSQWTASDTLTRAWTQEGNYTCRTRARCVLDTTVVTDWSTAILVVVKEMPATWTVTYELPDLVAQYVVPPRGEGGSRRASIPYDGPAARVVRLNLQLVGIGSGVECGATPSRAMDVTAAITLEDKGAIGLDYYGIGFFGMTPGGKRFDHDQWYQDEPYLNWNDPGIIAPGDAIGVGVRASLTSIVPCSPYGVALFEIYEARLSLELECASE